MEDEVFFPQNLNELLEITSKTKGTIYAGGTDIMVEKRKGKSRAADITLPIIHIKDIPELNKIVVNDNNIEIGSCCSYSKILENEDIPKILKDAILTIGGPAVRNFGTIGGNICNASPAADTIPVLAVLNSRLILQSKQGKREVKITDFIKGRKQIDLKDGEILTDIIFKREYLNNLLFQKFVKIGLRNAMTLSKISVAIVLTNEGKIHLAFGAVAPKVVRVAENEEIISKKKVSIEKFNQIYKKHFSAINDQRSEKEYRENTAIILGYNLYLEAYKILKNKR